MQRVINYGSYLQAYSLKKTIEKLGYDVFFVDIESGKQLITRNRGSSEKRKPVIIKGIIKRVQHMIYKEKRAKAFNDHYFSEISIDKPILEEECDMLVIGSDEVFNCCQPSPWGVSLQLFGRTKKPSITYAASAGYSNIKKIRELGIEQDIVNSLRNFKAISVRDRNTFELINNLGFACQRNLDPVLIFDWNQVIKGASHNFTNYILVYSYDNRISNVEEIAAIKQFAKKEKKELISFGFYQRWCDRNVMCSPLELICFFDSADFIITDTFHGTVISIKRNKKFATIVRDSNTNKITDLLEQFELEDRIVKKMESLETVIKKEIDYTIINKKIESETERSINYLVTNLHKY